MADRVIHTILVRMWVHDVSLAAVVVRVLFVIPEGDDVLSTFGTGTATLLSALPQSVPATFLAVRTGITLIP